ncbi:MAG: amino acid adenylation domain-containing protein [Chloroflexota bacterium]
MQILNKDQLANLSPEEKRRMLARLLKEKEHKVRQAPLSFSQERLWFLDQLEPGSASYNIATALQLVGRLRVDVLQGSLNEIVHRHAVLRTTFVAHEGRPAQIIAPAMEVTLPLVSLQHLPQADRREEAVRLATQEAQAPFDLARGPLIRAKLLRLGHDEHVLLLTMHHIVSDGWSLGVLNREVAAHYLAAAQGMPSPLPALPMQYADYAAWQRQWLQSEEPKKQLAYWKQQLAGAPEALNLPTDHPRPAVQTFNGASHVCLLSKSLSEQLEAFSQRAGVTLFMTLLAAFQALLARYTGQEDIVVGTPVANRRHAQIEGLIGCFINTLALRTDLAGDPTFTELLRRVRESTLGAYAHQDVPFESVVDAVQPQRDLSRSPLFQTMLVLQNAPIEAIKSPELTIDLLDIDNKTAKFDLLLSFNKATDGFLRSSWEYNTDLFTAETIVRMAGHFQTLLESVVREPERSLSQYALLAPAEKRQMLRSWNDTQTDFPGQRCLHELIAGQAARTPDAPAVVFEGQSLSYRELDQRANRLAHHLQTLGVRPETLVGVCMERSLDLVISLLAVLKAGGAYVPLDPDYPAERLVYMLADAAPAVLLTQPAQAAQFAGLAVPTLCLETARETLQQAPTHAPACAALPDNPAYMIYTSGSTGKPKGATNTHAGIVNRLVWMQNQYRLDCSDRVLQKTPFSFDVSVWEFFWPLLAGATLVVARPGGHKDGDYLAELIDREKITTLHFVPSMLQAFLSAERLEHRCTSLRRVICSGEALPYELQERFFQRLPAQLHNLYGPTEAAVDVTYWPCTAQPNGRRVVPIGKPIANTQIYILDRHLHPVPIGAPGELFIGGVGLARGYHNRPDLTAERFVPDPVGETPGTRLYRTGDLCRFLPDGNILFLGRIDHQVKIRGFRIELGEIEAALMEYPAVREAIVLAREDTPGDKRLVAYLVAHGREAPATGDLRHFLKERLPEHMLPARFIFLDELPLTPSGKADRKALPVPDQTALISEAAFVPPRNPTEAALVKIWQEVLGLARVGVRDNFFDLGGHSLLATQVLSRLRQAFQIEMPLRVLFEAPTLEDLAGQVERSQATHPSAGGPALVPVSRQDALPLSFSQQRLWFLAQLEPDSPAYNVPAAIRLRGRLDQQAFERSLNAVLLRHETLRTTFTLAEGQPVQVIAPFTPLIPAQIDLEKLPADEQGKQVEALALAEAQKPFDLATGPLLRVSLLRLSENDHVLLVTMHHIISDGWSIGVFVQEFSTRYRAFVEGREASLPALPLQYADYAAWQRKWLQGPVLEEQLNYWKEKLAGAPQALDLPVDRPRPAMQRFHGARYGQVFPAGLVQALDSLARQEEATRFMVALAAFQALLYQYSGQADLSIGTPIANRSRAEIEGLIGLFINTLVLRGDLSGDPDFRTVLRQAKETALDAYAHQDLPFEMLAEVLQPQRDLSRSPLFQVMLVLQNMPGERLEVPNLSIELLDVDNRTSKFDLTLYLFETPEGGLEAGWEYNTDLFEAATIARMAGHFAAILEHITHDPALRLSEISLLSPGEREQILTAWNDTQQPIPPGCIHQAFEAQARQTPGAIVARLDDETLTYRELNRRANRLAHHLQTLGVGPDVLVGLCVERSLEMLVGLLGILKAGGAYVPLDPAYPAERLRFMLEDAGIEILITQSQVHAALGLQAKTVCCLDTDWEEISHAPDGDPPAASLPEHLAYVIYTSGSTGKPKGAQITHRAVVNFLASMGRRPGLAAEDVWLSVTTLSFDIAVLELFLPLTVGAQVVLAPRAVAADGLALAALIGACGATIMQATPATWRLLLAAGWDGAPGLRILCGGEALPYDLAQALRQRGAALWNLYGPTETTIWSLVHRVDESGRPEATGQAIEANGRPFEPIGLPIANTQVYILDTHLRPLPVGVSGEIYIGGAGLVRGYLNRPELTAEKFIPHPFSQEPGARLYRTGDLGRYLPDGKLAFIGRIDHQVKVNGFRIELGEIETALRQHPHVGEAVVVAREDRPGDKQLVAYLTAKAAKPSATALREFLQSGLPAHMLPSAFVFLDQLPLTPNGKINRRALPAPDVSRPELETAYIAPQTSLERTIAGIWRDVLHLERVGLDDNFFDLGGHSMRLVQVHTQLQKAVTQPLTMLELFQYPTIRALAGYLNQDTGAGGNGRQRGEAIAALRNQAAGQQTSQTGIAIIGLAGRFPGADNPGELWRNLQNGIEAISTFSDEELLRAGVEAEWLQSPNYVRASGALENAEWFDAAFFGLSAAEAELTDPQQRIFLECAWEALENAGYGPAAGGGRVGVYAGVGMNTYILNLLSNRELTETAGAYQLMLANDKDFLATRASYKLNLHGPSLTVQTACSTSLVAVHLACQALLRRECQMALAGGVSVSTPPRAGYVYQEGGILSPDGHCRAFDANAQGTVVGNGAGIVVLKRLDDALADGDQVIAVIKGSATNNDGSFKAGYTAPSVAGQVEVITEAQAVAGVDPETITYIEAHGTGTSLGDPIEISALTQAFQRTTAKRNFCAIGSLKTNLGHLDAAAGVAGLIKTALALQHRQIPPSLHFESPNPQIDFEHSPFFVNTRLADWQTNGFPRRAGVSSFGIGGTNAHAVLEEAPHAEPSSPSRTWQLLTLSAKTPKALEQASANLAAFLRQNPGASLADVAFTLQASRSAFPLRRALVCQNTAEAATTLEPPAAPTEALSSPAPAFLFPGQGAQHAGMCRDLYDNEPVFRQHIDACAEKLLPVLGLDLRHTVYPDLAPQAPGDPDALEQTAITQPALFVWEYALAQLWLSWGIRPQAMLGHSIGEYAAACLAGVFSLDEALQLVAMRGRLMQSMPPGSMLAVLAGEADVQALLAAPLHLAAVNGPAACVVSGPAEAIDALEAQLNRQEIACRRLHTSHAFHSAMMDPILDEFVAAFAGVQLKPPAIPFISNLTGRWITPAEATDPHYWARHLRQAVRFADGLHLLAEEPQRVLLEVGPGQTLGALAKRMENRPAHIVSSLPHPREQRPDAAAVADALGKLWQAGISIDWHSFYAAERRRRIALPAYPFQRQRYWIERQARPEGPSRTAGLHKRPDISDWFYQPTWERSGPQPTLKPGVLEASPKRWLIFLDGCALGEAIAERLRRAGHSVAAVSPGEEFAADAQGNYIVVPHEAESYRRLLQVLQAAGQRPEAILHLWSVTAENPPAQAARRIQEQGLYSLLALAQAIGTLGITDALQLEVVSNQMHAVAGDESLCPAKATLLGACKIIPQEYPHITCRSTDVRLPAAGQPLERLAEALLAETSKPADALLVAHREPYRWTQKIAPAPLGQFKGTPARLRTGGVYLITGGLGGIGLTLAEYLAEQVQARLLLIGRGELPERSAWETWLSAHEASDPTCQKLEKLLRLENLGAEVLTGRADVADTEAMQACVDQARARWGQIHGVIHAAGVADYAGVIQRRSLADTAAVLAPKLDGTLVLESVLEEEALDFVILCSSISTIVYKAKFGEVGYCAANDFLDAYAQAQTLRGGPPTISINWDGWQSVGMSVEATQRQAERTGKPVNVEAQLKDEIKPMEGVEAFCRILEADYPQVIVATRDLLATLEQLNTRQMDDLLEVASSTQPAHERPELKNAYAAPRNDVEEKLAAIWMKILRLKEVGIHDDFFELGGDSLQGVRVISLAKQAGLHLTPQQVFEQRTIAELAAAVGTAAVFEAEQGAVTGPVPITYAQQLYLKPEWIAPHSWNITRIYSIPAGTNPDWVKQAVRRLLEHHDALRTRFTCEQNRWRAEILPPEETIPFRYIDFSGLPEHKHKQAIEQAILQIKSRLDLTSGPLVQVALFDLGADRPGRLLIVFHHILVDAGTIEIALQDFQNASLQASRGEAVSLPPKTTAYKHVAQWLAAKGRSQEMQKEVDYWLSFPWQHTPLPVDFPGAKDNTEASVRGILTSLTTKETRALLQDVPRQHNAQVAEVLLAAFTQAITAWHGGSWAQIKFGDNGQTWVREMSDFDLSRTVGLFASDALLMLERPADPQPLEALRDIQKQLQGIPRRGLGYELALNDAAGPEKFAALQAVFKGEVKIIYRGHYETDIQQKQENFLSAASEATGPSRDPREKRDVLLYCDAFVVQNRLNVYWLYSENFHKRETITRLAQAFTHALRSIIAPQGKAIDGQAHQR